MTDKYFIDTNIIAYSFDENNKHKRTISQNIITSFFNHNNYCISTQVVGEFCNIAEKKITPSVPPEKIDLFISTFPIRSIVTISLKDLRDAIQLKNIYKYSFWDSLILASALNANCSVLFTEDMQNGQIIEKKVKIVNPFI